MNRVTRPRTGMRHCPDSLDSPCVFNGRKKMGYKVTVELIPYEGWPYHKDYFPRTFCLKKDATACRVVARKHGAKGVRIEKV